MNSALGLRNTFTFHSAISDSNNKVQVIVVLSFQQDSLCIVGSSLL